MSNITNPMHALGAKDASGKDNWTTGSGKLAGVSGGGTYDCQSGEFKTMSPERTSPIALFRVSTNSLEVCASCICKLRDEVRCGNMAQQSYSSYVAQDNLAGKPGLEAAKDETGPGNAEAAGKTSRLPPKPVGKLAIAAERLDLIGVKIAALRAVDPVLDHSVSASLPRRREKELATTPSSHRNIPTHRALPARWESFENTHLANRPTNCGLVAREAQKDSARGVVMGRFPPGTQGDHFSRRDSRKPRDLQCNPLASAAKSPSRAGANDRFGSKWPFGRGVKPLCCGECQGASR